MSNERMPDQMKKLSPEEFEEIRRSRSFRRAMEALEAYVARPRGRPMFGDRPLTEAERAARYREAKRQQQEAGNQAKS
jgi:hypothetical protein